MIRLVNYISYYFYIIFPLLFSLMMCGFKGYLSSRVRDKKEMFMEIQGLWDVVVKEFGITLLVGFVFIRRSLSIETYATKTIQ